MLRPTSRSRLGVCRPSESFQTIQRPSNLSKFGLNSTISRQLETHKNVPPDYSNWWETKQDSDAARREKESWGDGYDENWEWYYQQLYRTIPKEYEQQSNYDKSSWIFNRAPIPTQKPTQWFENNLRDWKLGKWMQGFTELMNKRMRAPKFSRRPFNPIPRNMEHLVSYKNFKFLVQFLSPGGQILGTRFTGVRPKLQKKLSKEIKKARFLGLIPFTGNPFYDPTAERPGPITGIFDSDLRQEMGRVMVGDNEIENSEEVFDDFLDKHGLQYTSGHPDVDPTVLPDGRLLFRSTDTLMAVTELYDDYGDELELKQGLVARPPRPLEDRTREGETPMVDTVEHFVDYPGYKRQKMDAYPSDLMLNDITVDDDTALDDLLNDDINMRHKEAFEKVGFFEAGAEDTSHELVERMLTTRKANEESKKKAKEEFERMGLGDKWDAKRNADEGGVDLSSFDIEQEDDNNNNQY